MCVCVCVCVCVYVYIYIGLTPRLKSVPTYACANP